MATLLEVSAHHLHRSSLDHMDFHRVKWLDLNAPTDAELRKVCDLVHLPLHDLKAVLDRDEISRVTELDHFTMVVSKVPLDHHHHDHTSSTVLAYFISERLLITVHRDPVNVVEEALSLPDDRLIPLIEMGTSELFYHLFERVTNDFFNRLDRIEAAIDRIEDTVFNTPEQRTVRKIFSLKRTLIYFHKALAANRDIIVSLQKPETGKQIRNKVQHRLSNLYYDLVQLLDVVATYRDILTGTLDIYLSAVSNNMNAVMKKMAAYGTLVLVPTFITGLYGMNFRFMPELGWEHGYVFAWALIVLSVLALYWYFKRKDWF